MRYFIDTEFIDFGKPGADIPHKVELLSLGIVSEDGREWYAESSKAREWYADAERFQGGLLLQENVLPDLLGEPLMSLDEMKRDIYHWIGEDPDISFYGWYADYDWVLFCQLFGRMVDLPEHFPRYCRDLKQLCDMLDPVPLPPKPEGALSYEL